MRTCRTYSDVPLGLNRKVPISLGSWPSPQPLSLRGFCEAWLLSQSDAEAALELRNGQGESPLLLATRLCRGCVAMRLVEALADPGACDFKGAKPLMMMKDGDLDGPLRTSRACHMAFHHHFIIISSSFH